MSSSDINFDHEQNLVHVRVFGQDEGNDREQRMVSVISSPDWRPGYNVIVQFFDPQVHVNTADALRAAAFVDSYSELFKGSTIVVVNPHHNTAHVGEALSAAHAIKGLTNLHRVASLKEAYAIVGG